jgi:hypothetical protein
MPILILLLALISFPLSGQGTTSLKCFNGNLQAAIDNAKTSGNRIVLVDTTVTLTNTITLRENVVIRGNCPPGGYDYHPLGSTAKFRLIFDLNDPNKDGIVWEHNSRAYCYATGLQDLEIDFISPARTGVVMIEPYLPVMERVTISGNTVSGQPNALQYGISIAASVITDLSRVRIHGCREACLYTTEGDFGGGTLTLNKCYFTRAKIGCKFEAFGATINEFGLENIDSVGIYTNGHEITVTNGHFENVPLQGSNTRVISGWGAFSGIGCRFLGSAASASDSTSYLLYFSPWLRRVSLINCDVQNVYNAYGYQGPGPNNNVSVINCTKLGNARPFSVCLEQNPAATIINETFYSGNIGHQITRLPAAELRLQGYTGPGILGKMSFDECYLYIQTNGGVKKVALKPL